MLQDLVKGFIVGLAASIPLGPLGILCIQRTLSKGRYSGFITGLGTALSDTFYAALALLSLSFINEFLIKYQNWVLTLGGLIVALFGLKLFLTNPVKQIKRLKAGDKRYWEDFLSAFIMTITNPGALILILGIFALIGIDVEQGKNSGFLIATSLLGVFAGATTWWYTLSTTINLFRSRFRLRQLLFINRAAGIIIMLLGMVSTFEGIFRLLK